MRITHVTAVTGETQLRRRRAPILWPWVLVAGAWALAGLAVLTHQSYLINHHSLMAESHLPLLVALVVFLACWQVMTVGMMLPSSMPMVYMIAYAGRQQRRPYGVPGAFLAGYAVVWTAFALVAMVVDIGIHWLTESWQWLGTYPWLVGATTFAIAGIFQFSSLKGRCLKQCRSPFSFFVRYYRAGGGAAWHLGLRHGLFCLGCCWALMLIMFGVGIASLAGMAVLAGVMVLEKALLDGERMRPAVGVACLALAVLWLAHPAWLLQSVAGAAPPAPASAVSVGQVEYSGGDAITLQATPAHPGANTFVVTLKSGKGAAITNAHVIVETAMLDMVMGHQQVPLQPAVGGAPGAYRGQGKLPMGGHWELIVHVQASDGNRPFQAVFLLTVS